MLANAVSQRAAWVLVLRSLNYRVSDTYRWAGGAENASHLFWGQVGCLQRMGHLAGAWRRIIMLDAGKCCVAESSVGAGATIAELPREQCCIDGRTAQKWWRICFGRSWGARGIGGTLQQLCALAS